MSRAKQHVLPVSPRPDATDNRAPAFGGELSRQSLMRLKIADDVVIVWV